MYGEKLGLPIVVADIDVADAKTYYSLHHGSSLVFSLMDGAENLIARGSGISWNESYQMTPYMEMGQRHCLEVVKGAMPPGQISIQSAYFLKLNDTLPTAENLVEKRELTGIVQIAEHEDPTLKGLVLDVFEGVSISVQNGSFNAQSLYLRNATAVYRLRKSGMLWLRENPSFGEQTESHAAYPAKI
jgi:hypothetical protein